MTMPFVIDPLLTQYQRNGYYGYPMVQGYVNPAQNQFLTQNNPSALLAGNAQASAQPQQQYEVVTDENGNRYAAVQTVEDGNDDGKISAWSKLKNFGKGCLKFVTGMFTDENGDFSIWQTTKTVAIMSAAIAVSVASWGTAAAPAFATAGVALGVCTGGYKVVKGAINAATAKTDAEAEAAWQDMGLGATTIGVSVAGAKSAMKSVNNGATYQGNCLQATKDCFVTTCDNAVNLAKGIKTSYQAGTLMADATSIYNAAKTNFAANSKAIFDTSKAFANYKNQKISKIDNKIAGLDATKDAEQIAQLAAKKESLTSQFSAIENATTTEDVANVISNAENRVHALEAFEASKAEISSAESQLSALKTAGNIKMAQLKEAVIKANKAAGFKSDVTVTAKEGLDLLNHAFGTSLKRAIIHQAKHNPILAMDRNVDENGTKVVNYYAI